MDPKEKHDQVVRSLNGKKPPMDATPVLPPSSPVIGVGLVPAPDGSPQVALQITIPISDDAASQIAKNLAEALEKIVEIKTGLVVARKPDGLIVP